MYINPYFVATWAYAFNDINPISPTQFGTHWYYDSGSSVQVANYDVNAMWANGAQSSYYYNDDFNEVFHLPELGRTWAWHYMNMSTNFQTGSLVHVGIKSEYGGYAQAPFDLITTYIDDNTDSGCEY